ncbi:DUF1707 and FHA domain-containing protein [Allonocardiopsis opalescens]|uniref:Uncharacterized protein DUF1707 n=1 Tax=Allonocardiopsis opalescens TaxID=1144618 RepID=A0A2T0Q8B8_9ACTN|nr:DUF1707 and FHA domain-containing protein [Allonocardiopsis opalescens]PRY00076.1 uncharacterized protein DUF1707 [Allonocardiopsis opalescens]
MGTPVPHDEGIYRPSDRERDYIVDLLREHCVQGRLSQADFVERMEAALTAQSRRELGELIRDLPPLRPGGRAVPPHATQLRPPPYRMGPSGPPFGPPGMVRQRHPHAPRPIPQLMLPRPGTRDVIKIGRSPGSDLTLLDGKVSRRHAELRYEDDQWMLIDLGSMNGTHINGQRLIHSAPVQPGDYVTFGGMTFVLVPPRYGPQQAPPRLSAAPEPPEAAAEAVEAAPERTAMLRPPAPEAAAPEEAAPAAAAPEPPAPAAEGPGSTRALRPDAPPAEGPGSTRALRPDDLRPDDVPAEGPGSTRALRPDDPPPDDPADSNTPVFGTLVWAPDEERLRGEPGGGAPG